MITFIETADAMDEDKSYVATPITATEGTPEFLKKLAEKLDAEGEALVQTEADTGTENRATVH